MAVPPAPLLVVAAEVVVLLVEPPTPLEPPPKPVLEAPVVEVEVLELVSDVCGFPGSALQAATIASEVRTSTELVK